MVFFFKVCRISHFSLWESSDMSMPIRLLVLLGLLACPWVAQAKSELKTQNVLVVMSDGLRPIEVFGGADEKVMTKALGGVTDTDTVKTEYLLPTAVERREKLMPFLWSTMAKQGQIFGNRDAGSTATVTNGLKFSYPGYSETLCGFADPRISTNDPINNPNVTVFEWLNKRPTFQGRVAAFGAWLRFTHIFNADRCGFPVNCGFDPLTAGKTNTRIELLNRLKQQIPPSWDIQPDDALTYHTALEYLKENKPRLFFLALGETDEFGHKKDYPNYLRAANRYDGYLKEIWETVQAMPEYRGKTTLIAMTDHGRGDLGKWRGHKGLPNAEYIWISVLGPDTPALGERRNVAVVTQSQVAATIAALLGEDFPAAVPQAAPPIRDVLTVLK
jgi:hypothetical protein